MNKKKKPSSVELHRIPDYIDLWPGSRNPMYMYSKTFRALDWAPNLTITWNSHAMYSVAFSVENWWSLHINVLSSNVKGESNNT